MADVEIQTKVTFKSWTAPRFVRSTDGGTLNLKEAPQEVIDGLVFQWLTDTYEIAGKKCPYRHEAVTR